MDRSRRNAAIEECVMNLNKLDWWVRAFPVNTPEEVAKRDESIRWIARRTAELIGS